jgi:NitT/TauT family transport system substrate-binding protein
MIRIGHLSTFYHTSILMMARNTLATEAEWKLFGTGPAIVNAFEEGVIDLAYLGLPPAITGIDRGVPIKCIAGGHVEGTVISSLACFRSFPEIQDLRDILKQFAGLKIGVPGKGSIHDVILSECLKRLNLVNEIEVINFQWADLILEAIYREEVSAAVGTPALAAAVERFVDGKILYPPGSLWPNNPSYGILVHNDFLDSNHAAVENFLSEHEEAESFLRSKTRDAAQIIADYVKVTDEEFILDTLKISPKYCAAITDEYISSTMEFVRVLKGLGYIRREILSDEIFDMSLVRKIHPATDHYNSGISISGS